MEPNRKLASAVFVLLFLMLLFPLISSITGASISELRIQSQYNYIGWIVIAVVFVIIAVFVFLRFRPLDFGAGFSKSLYRPKSKEEEIRDYIEYKLSKGTNRLVIKEELLSVGWPKSLIDEAFRDADFKIEHAKQKKKKKSKR